MKTDTYQLEMFTDSRSAQGSISGGKNPLHLKNSLIFKKMQESQKFIFLIIINILISVIAFSLGVEKGKNNSASMPQTVFAIQKNNINSVKEENPIILKPAEKYTIQVASILKTANASREIGNLKSKGLSAYSAIKGKYTVIYVGTFPAKTDAEIYLKKIKPSYPDCQIRRL